MWVRIAEVYPVLGMAVRVSIHRHATPSSGQGESEMARQFGLVARHQLELLRLPRAQTSPLNLRREVRRRVESAVGHSYLNRRTVASVRRYTLCP